MEFLHKILFGEPDALAPKRNGMYMPARQRFQTDKVFGRIRKLDMH